MATLKKALFTRTEKVAQGDGKGPVFEKGNAYLMRPDSFDYWTARGAVVEAPTDMRAENEATRPGLRPNDVTIRKVRGGRYHVYGPGDHRFTDEAVDAGQAEQIRRDAISGKLDAPAPDTSAALPMDEPAATVEAEVIELAQIADGDAVKIYAGKDWPARTRVSAQFLADEAGKGMIEIDGTMLKITVENGAASYERDGGSEEIPEFKFIAGTWEPPPKASAI